MLHLTSHPMAIWVVFNLPTNIFCHPGMHLSRIQSKLHCVWQPQSLYPIRRFLPFLQLVLAIWGLCLNVHIWSSSTLIKALYSQRMTSFHGVWRRSSALWLTPLNNAMRLYAIRLNNMTTNVPCGSFSIHGWSSSIKAISHVWWQWFSTNQCCLIMYNHCSP